MFKIKNLVLVLLLALTINCAHAFTIGYVDYKKVQDNYALAKSAIDEIDDRALEMQRYMVDKEKEYKSIPTPVQQRAFEEKTAKELKLKQENFIKFKIKKQKEIYDNIITAIKAVAIEQKIDAVVDYTTIYTGGVDITDNVVKKLNTK